jgi:hypothetical protein
MDGNGTRRFKRYGLYTIYVVKRINGNLLL